MELAGTSSSATSAAFLRRLRAHHPSPLIVIWDNGSAHGGAGGWDYLATPDSDLRVLHLPASSPDFNADEAIWAWAREEVTANTCLGTKAKVQEKMQRFFDGLKNRTVAVQARCRTELQALVETVAGPADDSVTAHTHVDFTCASV